MLEHGTVMGVEGRRVRVRMKPGPECGSCCACSALTGGSHDLELESDRPVAPGDHVVVEIGSTSPVLSTLLVFVLPLVGLVAGVIVGSVWRPLGLGGDAASLVLGFGLMLLLFAFAAVIERVYIRKKQRPPAIVEVMGSENS